MPQSNKYPELLADMADCIQQRLCLTLPADQAETLSMSITEDIRARFAGCLVYIPIDAAGNRARRNKAIVAEFDGSNHKALARRYRVGISVIYDVIAKTKKAGEIDRQHLTGI